MTSPTLSSKTLRLGTLFVAAALTLGACRKDDDKAKEKASATATQASAEKSDDDDIRGARKAPSDDPGIDVPTEEDFEEVVANQITAETDLQKELDQLEKEITQ